MASPALSAAGFAAALPRWCAGVHRAAPELNELDGRLGDADLGATLDKCATLVEQALPELAGAPLDAMLRRCAQACAKASGSSFGTLLTVALMTAAKRCAGSEALARSDLAALLGEIVDTLAARGGASLGDKTVLDSLHAVRQALAEAPEGAALRPIACDAAQAALDAFRDRPNRIGRARMFADKTIGMDDPGMVALLRMAQSL
ncbi:dihydroxyacetone kinase subunit L [Xenophilus arseniciresistens]|uniref:Dihydroxyacetone kinase subunit L n=1 Tax=Xenophilus arseniciresistens TaxID=1283306 RepID=A0AAE3N9U3_9BURK|nr:dihydroxyacetone kinase subunit L [Xenophilus arseniciresistens]MDA7417283.1 dihydroxyacetone kinase subunit L [Xenophilus arseniciresistens]